MTQRPSGRISPLSSATGMKVAGGTDPRTGCVQRSSASKPRIAPFPQVMIGW